MPFRGTSPRLTLAALAVAVLAAACGSTGAAPSVAGPTPTPTPTAVPTPTAGPGDVTPAPSVAATAPSSSTGADASPAATSEALPTMGPAELAFIDRFPARILDVPLEREAHDVASLADSSPGWKQFVTFATELGLDPKKVLVGYAYLKDGKAFKAKYGDASFLFGGFRFTGADPATLPEAFLKVSSATQPGSSSSKQTIAGREVWVLDPGSDAGTAEKSYAVFVGDTVFFGGSGDPALLDAIIRTFPQ